jgi:hypothetical protein
LLLQEFDITIKDKKGTKNVVEDHLSRLTIDSASDITQINDYFLDQSLLSISTMPWFANLSIFLQQEICQLIGVPKTKESF